MTSDERGGTPVIAIVGPTATGKTALAVDLCQQLDGEIIGADSVQVYRHCNIGAAKPRRDELQGVAHHLLDVVDPDQPMDAARFAALADGAIAAVCARGKVPVVVGGTGLWLRALLLGLLALPKVDHALRQRLEEQWRERGPEAMHRRLRAVDPRSAAAIHPNDRLRVVRALEVHAQTGRALGELRHAHARGVPRYCSFGILLDLPRPLHDRQVAARTRTMIERGFADEVQALVQRFGLGIRPLSAVGYRQMLRHVRDGAPLPAVEADIVRATRGFARHQRTWFNGDPTVTVRTDPSSARSSELRDRLRAHLRR